MIDVVLGPEMSLGLVALAVAAYGLVAGWLGRRSVSAAFAFVVIGAVIGGADIGVLPRLELDDPFVGFLTEVTLALVLFSAASSLSVRQVEADSAPIIRLLAIGLTLTIAAGAVLALGLLPDMTIGLAILIGAILAPTDADLGHAVISDPSVPARIRRILNVESGLNDGIAAPVVAIAIGIATVGSLDGTDPIALAVGELGVATLVGIAWGGGGGWLFSLADRVSATSGSSRKLTALALAVSAFFVTDALGGSGFIAAFVAGLTFGVWGRQRVQDAVAFTEAQSILLSIVVWLIFGLVLVEAHVLGGVDPAIVLYALLSLTVVRMIPIALALLGEHLHPVTVAFMGWFGPRGLASIVFTLLAIESFDAAGVETGPLVPVVTWTVLLSIVLHGFSARPLASWYGRWAERLHGESAEAMGSGEPRMRGSMWTIHDHDEHSTRPHLDRDEHDR